MVPSILVRGMLFSLLLLILGTYRDSATVRAAPTTSSLSSLSQVNPELTNEQTNTSVSYPGRYWCQEEIGNQNFDLALEALELERDWK